MQIYKRILVATDFSDINLLAIERATKLARQNDCELILFHVIEHFPMGGEPLSSVFQYNAGPDDQLAKHIRDRVLELRKKIDYQNVKTELRITSKSARHEILRFANVHEVDLIVVAPHGQGIIGTLGSTATGILNNASCDVLAVRDSNQEP